MGAIAQAMEMETGANVCGDVQAEFTDGTLCGLLELWGSENLTRCGREAFLKRRATGLAAGEDDLLATREGLLAALVSEAAGSLLSKEVARLRSADASRENDGKEFC